MTFFKVNRDVGMNRLYESSRPQATGNPGELAAGKDLLSKQFALLTPLSLRTLEANHRRQHGLFAHAAGRRLVSALLRNSALAHHEERREPQAGLITRTRMHQRQLVSQVDVTQYIEITPSISI